LNFKPNEKVRAITVMKNKIYLGWAHSKNSEHQNFGDELSPYLISKLTKSDVEFIPVLVSRFQLILLVCKRICFFRFKEAFPLLKILFGYRYLLSTGSILQFYKYGRANVWGSGLISKNALAGKNNVYFSVRGKYTRELLINQNNEVPEVYGDPALILRKIYDKQVNVNNEIAIIPHIIHYDEINKKMEENNGVKIINLNTSDVESIIDEIRSSKFILSSSLHGIIVAHAYGIPALWVKLSEKELMGDNLKFADYFSSVGITPYEVININQYDYTSCVSISIQNSNSSKANNNLIDSIVNNLLQNAPFKINSNLGG